MVGSGEEPEAAGRKVADTDNHNGSGSGQNHAVSNPFQAASTTRTATGTPFGSSAAANPPSSPAGIFSDDLFEMPDFLKSTLNGINSSKNLGEQARHTDAVPSTSTLPAQSRFPSHIFTDNRPQVSMSAPSSPPTISQLRKGKHREGSVPLPTFGNDTMDGGLLDFSSIHGYSVPSNAPVPNTAGGSTSVFDTFAMNGEYSLPSDMGSLSLPSAGLFPTDSSDMGDLFGPGSAALFEQLRAAMGTSPEPPPWIPPRDEDMSNLAMGETHQEQADSDSDDDDDDGQDMTFNFDLDAQIDAAMASLTETTQVTAPEAAAGVASSPLRELPLPELAAPHISQSPEQTVPVSGIPDIPQEGHSKISSPPLNLEDQPGGLQGGSDDEEDDDDDEEEEANAQAQFDLDAMLASAMNGAAPPLQEEDIDSDMDESSPAPELNETAAQFDLDAMLASAMGQATQSLSKEDSHMQEDAMVSTSVKPDEMLVLRQPEAIDSSDESDDEEEGEEPAFDLDAHLREAMAYAQAQASMSPGEEVQDIGTPLGPPSDDESSDDEGFDLDAQIGAALAGQILTSAQEQIALRKAATPAKPVVKESSPDFLAHDLQNMLQAAMQQAALELEQEQQEQTLQLEGMAIAAKEQAQAFPDQPVQALPTPFIPRRFVVPPKPRTRPRVDDDGDLENAFNRSRQAHPQALHSPHICDFKGCDKVFAKAQSLQLHRQTHKGATPYKCHFCPATFAVNQDLQDHAWSHNRTREWKYRCKGCFNLFGDKGMFDQHVKKAKDPRCSKNECELQMRPAGARLVMPPINPSLLNTYTPRPGHDNYFVTSAFDPSALLAATLVHQMSSLLARQYDRQTSLLGPNDPRIDVNAALRQTFQRAGLTPNETAALATLLATVGYARNEGLKASLDEARKAQFEAYRKHQERQRKAAIKQIKRERKRLKAENDRLAAQARRKAEEVARVERRRQAEAQKNGDIPVPQAQAVM